MHKGIWVLALGLLSCQSEPEEIEVFNDQWSGYSKALFKEIEHLNATQPGCYKTVSAGEEIHSEEIDSCNYAQEYAVFLHYDLALAEKRFGTYAKTVDSSAGLVLTRYTCSDTAAELREFQHLTNKGQVQLMEWDIVSHAFLMDRTMKLSVQPGKGYRIWVKENPLWASESEYEIFAELHNPELLQSR